MKSDSRRFAQSVYHTMGVVITLTCLLAAVDAAATSRTAQCPSPNPITKKNDPDHFYSDPAQNHDDKAPDQCNSCQDPGNAPDRACAVYDFLHSSSCDGQTSCENRDASFNIYRKRDLRYALALLNSKQAKLCHAVVFAFDPVIGVEDANHRGEQNFWNHAYFASQKLLLPAVSPDELALAINPATRRGQHQLHIHIGKQTPTYQRAIRHLKKSSTFQKVTINGIDFQVSYVDDQTGLFAGLSPFESVSNVYGERFMPREGIIAARSKDQKGWFILAALDTFVEGQLDYASSQKCQLK